MIENIRDSVVTITSDSESQSIGTGFVIHRDKGISYILTCAHVVAEVGDSGKVKVKVDGRPAKEVTSRDRYRCDLAVLEVKDNLIQLPVLKLGAVGKEGREFIISGYFKSAGQDRLEDVKGKLGASGLTNGEGDRARTWNLEISEDSKHKLKKGYSGSPVVDRDSGCVLGVVSLKEGQREGLAISIEALGKVWDQYSLLLQQDYVEVSIEDREFQTNIPNIKVTLGAFIHAKFEDLDKTKSNIDIGISKKIQGVAINVIQDLLEKVEPERFYIHFYDSNFNSGKSLEWELKEKIKSTLLEHFNIHIVDIVLTPALERLEPSDYSLNLDSGEKRLLSPTIRDESSTTYNLQLIISENSQQEKAYKYSVSLTEFYENNSQLFFNDYNFRRKQELTTNLSKLIGIKLQTPEMDRIIKEWCNDISLGYRTTSIKFSIGYSESISDKTKIERILNRMEEKEKAKHRKQIAIDRCASDHEQSIRLEEDVKQLDEDIAELNRQLQQFK